MAWIVNKPLIINNTKELLHYLQNQRNDSRKDSSFNPAVIAYQDAIRALETLMKAQAKTQKHCEEEWLPFPPDIGGEG